MIENVGGIHADHETFRFTDAHCLTHRRVEAPVSRQFQSLPAECASCSRFRILKQNLTCLGIGNRLQRAELFQVSSDQSTLRICDLRECIAKKVSKVAVPPNVSKSFNRERSNDVRHRTSVESRGAYSGAVYVRGTDAYRLAGTEVHDETRLPPLDRAGKKSRAISEEGPAGSQR